MRSRVDLEEARKQVDNEILALKTRRNTYAPISHLSEDLLLEIFRELGDAHFNLWYQITHVCRDWRHVALSAASLWTRPPTHLHDHTLLMLERSRSSPLSIQLLDSTSTATSAAVLSHIGRIESLIVEQPTKLLGHLQQILLRSQHEAAQLKTLRISQVAGPPYTPQFKLWASPFRKMPLLKHLSLANIDLEWHIFPIRSLTSLKLDCPDLRTRPSWAQFCQALREMPSLEHLSLGLDSVRPPAPGPSHPEPLELLLLQTLEISDSDSFMIRTFLSNVSFPCLRAATVDCIFTEGSANINNYSATLGMALSLIPKGSFGHLDSLLFTHQGSVRFASKSLYDSDDDWANRHALDFNSGDLLDRSRNQMEIIMAALTALPSDPTSTIKHIHFLRTMSTETLVNLFGHLPCIESITSKHLTSWPIIRGLKISPLHPPDLSIPFPKLRSLNLSMQGPVCEYTPQLLDEMCDCLMLRYEYGAPMRELAVDWPLTPAEGQLLQEIVVDAKYRQAGATPAKTTFLRIYH